MREVFAHDAVVAMEDGGDLGAPGAAITIALCGHWEHDPPCPLAPHHTAAEMEGESVRLRVLFAAEPEDEPEVRRRIEQALAEGEIAAPDGALNRWRLLSSDASAVRPDEYEHGGRLRS